MEPFSALNLHEDILVILAGLSDSNPGDEVVALKQMSLVVGKGSPMPNCCRMPTHLHHAASIQVTRNEGGPQSHRQGLG